MNDGVMHANGTLMVEPRMNLKHVADAIVYIADLLRLRQTYSS